MAPPRDGTRTAFKMRQPLPAAGRGAGEDEREPRGGGDQERGHRDRGGPGAAAAAAAPMAPPAAPAGPGGPAFGAVVLCMRRLRRGSLHLLRHHRRQRSFPPPDRGERRAATGGVRCGGFRRARVSSAAAGRWIEKQGREEKEA